MTTLSLAPCASFYVLASVLLSIPMVSSAQDRSGDALCVMTFNLRFASNQKPNAWPDRRPVMAELIKQTKPDLIGTQEGVYQQLKDLASDLPDYAWIGLGREGGSRGEFMAVFYDRQRFDPLEFDHYWLSDTPQVMASKGWGNNVIRMVTWVRFLDRKSNQRFLFVNTHFDHQSQPSREKSAELLRQRLETMKTQLPIIVTGDFNAAAKNNRAYSILTGGDFLKDTWETARERKGEIIGTFHNYRGARPDGARIDWILTGGPVAADATQVITFSRNGQYPSDHFPVAAWLRFVQKDGANP